MRRTLMLVGALALAGALAGCNATATKGGAAVLSGPGDMLSGSTATTINTDAKIAGEALCGGVGALYNATKGDPAAAATTSSLKAALETAADICSKNLIGATPVATLENLGAQVLQIIAQQAIKAAAG